MKIAELVSKVQDLGVTFWIDGDDLRYTAPRGALTQHLRAELVERKAEILAWLRQPHDDLDSQPQPIEAGSEEKGTFVPPRTPVENVLSEIWSQVLEVDRVGVHDNFFELGGDSVLLTQVVSRVRDTLLVDIPLHVLFQAQTISGLAQTMLEDWGNRSEIEAVAELLIELAQLSEEEVEARLAQEAT